jgi:hypothetical protein
MSCRYIWIICIGRAIILPHPDHARFCHEEMAAARDHGLPVVGVMKTDTRFGCPDFGLERQRANIAMGGRVIK